MTIEKIDSISAFISEKKLFQQTNQVSDTDSLPQIIKGKNEETDVIKGCGIEKKAENNKKQIEIKQLKEMWSPIAKGVSDDFFKEIVDIAHRVNCDPIYLSIVLYQESKFNPKASNGSYKGIGQMSQTTLSDSLQYVKNKRYDIMDLNHKMTINGLTRLSREKQLPYIEAYIINGKRLARMQPNEKLDAGNLYALFFLPSQAKKNVLAAKNSDKTRKYYRSNAYFDINKDGKITAAELKKFLLNQAKEWGIKLPDGYA